MSQPMIYLRVNRVAPELCARARAVTVADLHENTSQFAYAGVMSSRMRRVTRGHAVGSAITAFDALCD